MGPSKEEFEVKRGRPQGPRMKCGWGCAEQLGELDATAFHGMS